jgi:hypothetical protein
MDMNLPRNLPKKQSILLMETCLDKTHLTTFTFVCIIVVFFAARATHSATKVALAKTDIRFIHMLIITIALIGFEIARIYN